MNEHELENVMIFYSTEQNWGPETMDLFSDFMELRSKRKSITNRTQYFSSILLRAWQKRQFKKRNGREGGNGKVNQWGMGIRQKAIIISHQGTPMIPASGLTSNILAQKIVPKMQQA